MKITKDMKLGKVIEKYPGTVEIFLKYGLGCMGCSHAGFETIEEGANAHGIKIEKLVKELNEEIKDENKG